MTRRILQIGLGNRGRMWAGIIAARTDVSHAAAVDPDPDARAWFTDRNPGVPVFDRLDTALSTVNADLALLVTPPDGHLDQARQLFAAGLSLLAEKPLAEDLAEAIEI